MNTIMVVLTDAVEGRDEEFNQWYSGPHLSDVLAIDGFAAAQRFELVQGKGPHRYLAIYEIEEGKLEAARTGLAEARASGAMEISEAMGGSPALWVFSALTDRMSSQDAGEAPAAAGGAERNGER